MPYLIQAAQIQHDAAAIRICRPLNTAAAAPRRNRHAKLVRPLHHLRHLIGSFRSHGNVGLTHRRSSGGCSNGVPPLIVGVLLPRFRLRNDVLQADDSRQRLGKMILTYGSHALPSVQSRFFTLTSTFSSSATASIKCCAKRVKAISPFSAVPRCGTPITPESVNSS